MSPKRLAYVIVSMMLVATFAMLLLNNMYEEVPKNHKYLILATATLFSGLVAYLLFPKELDEKRDSKNSKKETNKTAK